MLTVVTTFESGQLVVNADAADSITIAVNGAGELVVNNNNDPTGAGPFPASSVTSINVQGGPSDNNIDLAAVTQDDFTGLNGVTISGGDGQDNIIGSEFADVINGDDGIDIIDGLLGSDTITGSGTDEIILNGSAFSVSYIFTGSMEGLIQIQSFSSSRVIIFDGIQTIHDNLMNVGNREFEFPDTDDVISIADDGDDLNGLTLISRAAGTDVLFTSPIAFLVDTGAGSDDITLGLVDKIFVFDAFNFIVRSGDGNDVLDAIALNQGVTFIGGRGNDTIIGSSADDRVFWSDGDGSDSIDGEDNFEISTSELEDQVHIGASGNRFFVNRQNLTPVVLDIGTVEVLMLDTIDGNDEVTIGDLSTVGGLSLLRWNGGDDNDMLDLAGFQAGTVDLVPDGGSGDDTIIGSAGNAAGDGTADEFRVEANEIAFLVEVEATQLIVNGSVLFSLFDISGNDTIIVNGSSDDDTVTVDFSSQNPLANDTLEFNGLGQTPSGADTLEIVNGSADMIVHTFESASSGSVQIDNSMIVYTGLEPIMDNMDVVDRVFTFGENADEITLSDDAMALNNMSRISSNGSSETVEFTNPSGSLLINSGEGDDTVNINSLDEMGAVSIEVKGQIGNDVLVANGFSMPVTLSGNSGNDTLNGNGATDLLIESADVDFVLSDVQLSGVGSDTVSNIEEAELTGGKSRNDIDAADFSGRTTLIGLAGRDSLHSGQGGSSLDGGNGDDLLDGNRGRDLLLGGGGEDRLFGGMGNDTLTGGASNDTLNGQTGSDTILEIGDTDFVLTNVLLTRLGTDTIKNIEKAVLTGGSGNNTIETRGFTGNVTLAGGIGNDTLRSGAGNDVVLGESGDDLLAPGAGSDSLDGGDGNDRLFGGSDDDSLTGGMGNDTIQGHAGNDTIVETADANFVLLNTTLTGVGVDALLNIELAILTGGASQNVLDARGFSGNTTLSGGDGNDLLLGGIGDDSMNGGAGDDAIAGAAGNDRLAGKDGRDLMLGGGGDDVLFGGAKDDAVVGGSGSDSIDGQGGEDTLTGGSGAGADPGDIVTGLMSEIDETFALSVDDLIAMFES